MTLRANRIGLPLLVTALLLSLPVTPSLAETPPIQPELDRISREISEAESENAKLAGGLVKALIEARLATLRQSKAMLEQRKAATDFNVSLRYTVDGKAYSPPANAKEELASIGHEIESMKLKIAAAENEVSKYSGGLVLAMAMSTLATVRQSAAMLDQRRLALTYGLPQYIGTFSNTAPTLPSGGASATAPTSPPTAEEPWDITEVHFGVTERNSTWWKYSWRVGVRNRAAQPIVVRANMQFLNRDGLIVDDDDSDDTRVNPGETVSLTGYDLVTAEVAGNIVKGNARVKRVQ